MCSLISEVFFPLYLILLHSSAVFLACVLCLSSRAFSSLRIDFDILYVVVYLFGSVVGERNYGILVFIITVHSTKYLPIIR